MMFRPSMYTRVRAGSTRSTLPRLPRSLPLMTITSSPDLMRAAIRGPPGCAQPRSQDLRRERDDLHEVPFAQLARDGAEDARPARVVLGVDQHDGVLVEP